MGSGSLAGLMRVNLGDNYWTGVLAKDVRNITKERKVAVIECQSLDQVKKMKERGLFDCFYVYIRPPSVDDIEVRMIRNRFGLDTQASLNHKLKLIRLELSMIEGKQRNLFDKILVNDNRQDFLKRAGVHVVYNLYKRRLN